jgi:GTP-binding nuclear protein Ran
MNAFSIIFVGDSGVGKTTFLQRHLTGVFEKNHIATIGSPETVLSFPTNKGEITLTVIDHAGSEKLSSESVARSHAGIVFFDTMSEKSYDNASNWIGELRALMGEKYPIILVGNKVDCNGRKVKPADITLQAVQYRLLRYFGKGELQLHAPISRSDSQV